MNWYPMTSAPHDGTEVLLKMCDWVVVGYFHMGAWHDPNGRMRPVAWMPLP